MGIVKHTLQTELIDRCIERMYKCAIRLELEEEQKFVVLAQIVLREFDVLSPKDKHKVLKCHRTIKMPSGEYYRASNAIERRKEFEDSCSESIKGSDDNQVTDKEFENCSD